MKSKRRRNDDGTTEVIQRRTNPDGFEHISLYNDWSREAWNRLIGISRLSFRSGYPTDAWPPPFISPPRGVPGHYDVEHVSDPDENEVQ